jgi:16S rRNA pseudouridine516 synthase
MRLDRLLANMGYGTRTEVKKLCRERRIAVNGTIVTKSDAKVDEEHDTITLDGMPVLYEKYSYFMLNKPAGYISATEGNQPTVMDLIPEGIKGLFPCGRLDKNTLGLMLLTNNGELAHRLLAPKRHVDKTYRYRVKFPLSDEDMAALERGVDIGGYVTAPCCVTRGGEDPAREGSITLHEGKYHQIKLMMEACHNQITHLERVTFGPLSLPTDMERGSWRYLTDEEIEALHTAAGLDTK